MTEEVTPLVDTPRAPEWRNDPKASPVLVMCDAECQARAYAPLPVLRESGWEVTRLGQRTLCPAHNKEKYGRQTGLEA